MRGQVLVVLLAAGLMAGAAQADDVYLTNGESFEGVIAVDEGERVRVQLAFGELVLPRSGVLRIERSRSVLAEYRDRRQAIEADFAAPAKSWLELALWARAQDLDHGFRESLLQAADLDPRLEALRPHMRRLGYVLNEALEQWIPYAEHMRLSGFVAHNGEWVRPEERRAAVEERRSAERDSGVEESLSRTIELLALAQLERESRQSTEVAPVVPYAYPMAHFGGWYFPTQGRQKQVADPLAHRIVRQPTDPLARQIVRSQPGSVLPIQPIRPSGGHNRAGFVRQR